ncbi:MAG TPA: hypothetical protein VLZ83_14605 [Edaphocola sp.]|nr:hypothetical protein [Edaphocola sp.]
MRLKLLSILFTIPILFFTSCNNQQKRTINRGFYYWKTNVNISPYEQSYMDSLKTHLLYVRFFDVEAHPNGKGIKPLAIINFGENLGNYKIIPTVYITTNALKRINWQSIPQDAKNIADLLEKKSNEIHLNSEEVQIDCDWTSNTKWVYFEFLRALKKEPFFQNKILSVTIRMHQIKYRAASGLPPADKGLLMVYNMDKAENVNTENSIFNEALAKDYLKNIATYPMKLDIALPIFSWSLLFEKGKLMGILRDIDDSKFKDESLFEQQKKNRFVVLKDSLFFGYSLRKGQLIRFEDSDMNAIKNISKFLSKNMNLDTTNILLYHCDAKNFKRYKTDDLQKVFSSF